MLCIKNGYQIYILPVFMCLKLILLHMYNIATKACSTNYVLPVHVSQLMYHSFLLFGFISKNGFLSVTLANTFFY